MIKVVCVENVLRELNDIKEILNIQIFKTNSIPFKFKSPKSSSVLKTFQTGVKSDTGVK